MMNIQEFKTALFAKGREQGFGHMEIFYSTNKATTVNVLNQEVKSYVIAEQGGLSFRGIYQNQMGYSYTEKIDELSIDLLVEEAVGNAQVIEMDEQEELFAGADHYETLHRYSEAVAKVSPQELITAAFAMEQAALGADPLVKRVINCSVAKSEGETLIDNTLGLHCHEKHTSISAGVYLMASDGDKTATGGEYDFTLKDFGALQVKEIAKTAAQEAISKLDVESIGTGNYPIIFRYDAATQLLGSFVSVLSGEVVEKGFSRLQGKLGKKIAGSNVTLLDDPVMEDVPGGATFDAEGYPTKKLALIKEGILLSFMHNLKTAKKAGTQSTGNAGKSGYNGTVSVGPHNLYLQPGARPLADLISDTDHGIFLVELQGTNAGINAISGDFSLSAIGFLIENGKVGRGINQITVSGNLYELLNQIDEIGSDLVIKSSVSSPSIKVKSLTVAGK